MRVTHVITKGNPMGGTQIDTFQLLKWQHARYDVDLVMGNDGPLRAACEDAGIPVTVISMQNRYIAPFSDLRALFLLMRHFKAVKPDLVHTHSSKAGLLGRLAATVCRVPAVVHTLHVLPYHDRQPALLRSALVGLERFLFLVTDHVVAVAETLRSDFIEHHVCSSEHVTTIGSGIDFSAFPANVKEIRAATRTSLGIDRAVPVVISVANLEPRKRYDVFVEAAAATSGNHPDAQFLIAGVGETRAATELQIRRLGQQDRIHLLGYRPDVPALLAASDIFVQTSQLEGLSRSLIEAMYAGLLVVATDTDGTRELVTDGVNGYIIPEGDVPALTTALSGLLSDRDLRRQMGDAGRTAVGDRWSIEAMGSGHDALYEKLLGSTPPARPH